MTLLELVEKIDIVDHTAESKVKVEGCTSHLRMHLLDAAGVCLATSYLIAQNGEAHQFFDAWAPSLSLEEVQEFFLDSPEGFLESLCEKGQYVEAPALAAAA